MPPQRTGRTPHAAASAALLGRAASSWQCRQATSAYAHATSAYAHACRLRWTGCLHAAGCACFTAHVVHGLHGSRRTGNDICSLAKAATDLCVANAQSILADGLCQSMSCHLIQKVCRLGCETKSEDTTLTSCATADLCSCMHACMQDTADHTMTNAVPQAEHLPA
ncbi:hypothetical protein COO60DRAFT_388153 [Scenedesmus sp. NREL 46B-D3]|nr:hypothetical protein COO60DRAFT_388153 [Scenedesmus sp. NREL 46B-D3]